MSQSTQDTRLTLFQRPLSRIEATQKTVQLLNILSKYNPWPPTFHLKKLEEMIGNFTKFQKEQPQIGAEISKLRDKLFNVLNSLFQLLEEDLPARVRHEKVNNIIKQTINNANLDLEGTIFEIRRDLLISKIQEKIEKIKLAHYSPLLKKN